MVSQLVKFVDYFHCRNIVITDLKPSHIFISSEGQIKMFAFTMGQVFQRQLSRSKGPAIGNPFYIAPEVVGR